MAGRFDGLRLIALFKFAKAITALLTAYGLHKLFNPEIQASLHAWVATLSDHFAQRLILQGLSVVEGMGPAKHLIAVGLPAAYTVVALTEGIGLWLHRRWAEWLTTIATAVLIPFELNELITHLIHHKRVELVVLVLLLNVAVVWYLLWHIRQGTRGRAG